MTVEVEGGGGGNLRFLDGGGGFGGFYDIFLFFTSNCARLLILYINYSRGQDTTRGTKFILNKLIKIKLTESVTALHSV